MSSSDNALGGLLNVSINESSTYSPRIALIGVEPDKPESRLTAGAWPPPRAIVTGVRQ